MTWRLDGLARRAWLEPGWANVRCEERCGWGTSSAGPRRTNRLARDHTRQTGHVTRTAQIKVTEYRAVPA
jgi:hypothetical protein